MRLCGYFFVICVSCLSLLYCLVCSLQPCDHMLGKDWPLGSLVYVMFSCVFVTISYGVAGQVWYLIELIPDFAFFLT